MQDYNNTDLLAILYKLSYKEMVGPLKNSLYPSIMLELSVISNFISNFKSNIHNILIYYVQDVRDAQVVDYSPPSP